MWEVSIPDPHNPGLFRSEAVFDTKEEALKVAKNMWGADKEGRITIVNEIEDEDMEEDEEVT